MLKAACRGLVAVFLAALVTGCVSSSVNINGRSITGHGGLFCTIHAHSSATGAFVVFGSKTVHVSQKQVCWDDGNIDLPEGWKKLDLKESFGDVKVIVDDKEVTTFKI